MKFNLNTKGQNKMNDNNFLEFMAKLVTKYCGYNPGAISFYMECLSLDSEKCIFAFERMLQNDIREEKLYMLWNDCCDRDTKKALNIMINNPIEDIIKHINYEHGRGIPYAD